MLLWLLEADCFLKDEELNQGRTLRSQELTHIPVDVCKPHYTALSSIVSKFSSVLADSNFAAKRIAFASIVCRREERICAIFSKAFRDALCLQYYKNANSVHSMSTFSVRNKHFKVTTQAILICCLLLTTRTRFPAFCISPGARSTKQAECDFAALL